MTDNDIVKALECCTNEDVLCSECPLIYPHFEFGESCIGVITKSALDLIHRRTAEIERLKKELIEQQIKNNLLYETAKEIRTEAIKEFAERLKKSSFHCDVSFGYGKEHCEEAVTVLEIDRLVKEMAEETP